MSNELKGVYRAKQDPERGASASTKDNGRHMIDWTREQLTEYIACCATGHPQNFKVAEKE